MRHQALDDRSDQPRQDDHHDRHQGPMQDEIEAAGQVERPDREDRHEIGDGEQMPDFRQAAARRPEGGLADPGRGLGVAIAPDPGGDVAAVADHQADQNDDDRQPDELQRGMGGDPRQAEQAQAEMPNQPNATIAPIQLSQRCMNLAELSRTGNQAQGRDARRQQKRDAAITAITRIAALMIVRVARLTSAGGSISESSE